MIVSRPEGVVVSLHVVANAAKNEIIGPYNNALKIKIKSPPVDGKANAEIESFLAKKLGIAKNQVKILKGDKSKIKKVLIRGVAIAAVTKAFGLDG